MFSPTYPLAPNAEEGGFAHAAGHKREERPIVARRDHVDIDVHQVAEDFMEHQVGRTDVSRDV